MDSSNRIIFCNSNIQTQNLCKTFWHNAQNLPPAYESTLYSYGIKQRMRKAQDLPVNYSQLSKSLYEDSRTKSDKYLKVVYLQQEADQIYLNTVAKKQNEIRLLEKYKILLNK